MCRKSGLTEKKHSACTWDLQHVVKAYYRRHGESSEGANVELKTEQVVLWYNSRGDTGQGVCEDFHPIQSIPQTKCVPLFKGPPWTTGGASDAQAECVACSYMYRGVKLEKQANIMMEKVKASSSQIVLAVGYVPYA